MVGEPTLIGERLKALREHKKLSQGDMRSARIVARLYFPHRERPHGAVH